VDVWPDCTYLGNVSPESRDCQIGGAADAKTKRRKAACLGRLSARWHLAAAEQDDILSVDTGARQ
jgi:hypothetical protein